MKTSHLFLAAGLTIGLSLAAYYLLPGQWFRHSGILDLAVVLDRGVSNRDNLPAEVGDAHRLLKSVLPGDRVAVYAVGPEVNELMCGPVSSAAALSLLDRQVEALRPASAGGALLGEGFARVRAAFDLFLRDFSGKHRRVLVVFSDCSAGGLEEADASSLAVAGQTSVLVIGFRGKNKDAVTQALMGLDASNDVLIVPSGEAAGAINNLLDATRWQCHPLRVPRLLLLLALCAVAGAASSIGIVNTATRKDSDFSIRLTTDDEEGTAQVFPLADGAAISIGGGGRLHDFVVPVEASCSLARSARCLSLLPGSGRLTLQRGEESTLVSGPCPVNFGDTFRLEGAAVTLQKS